MRMGIGLLALTLLMQGCVVPQDTMLFSLNVNPAQVCPGDTVTLKGERMRGKVVVAIQTGLNEDGSVKTTQLGEVHSDGRGNWTLNFVMDPAYVQTSRSTDGRIYQHATLFVAFGDRQVTRASQALAVLCDGETPRPSPAP